MDKRCTKCGEIKDIELFSRDKNRKDEHDPHCKECKIKYQKSNIERLREYWRKYHWDNRETILPKMKQRRHTEKAKQRKAEKLKEYRKIYPEKNKARQSVASAIRRGAMKQVSSFICCVCKEKKAEHYHHHKGYDKEHWLDVIPVCRDCHNVLDNRIKSS